MRPWERLETRLPGRWNRTPPTTAMGRAGLRLGFLLVPLFLVAALPGSLGRLFHFLVWCCTLSLGVIALVLLYRQATRRLLWKVRDRLIATYLLMGLAPVVLLGTLNGIAAYVFSGQFAISSTMAELDSRLERMRDRSAAMGGRLAHTLGQPSGSKALQAADTQWPEGESDHAGRIQFFVWQDGLLVRPTSGLNTNHAGVPSNDSLSMNSAPAWVHPGYSGVAFADGQLYLCAVHDEFTASHHLLVLAALQLNRESLASIAGGIGSVSFLPGLFEAQGPSGDRDLRVNRSGFGGILGGPLAPSTFPLDFPVYFNAPLLVTDWHTGEAKHAVIGVVSRPSLLYRRLFAGSVQVGAVLRFALIAIAALFALFELLALWMALRLSRTITQSIADLYGATVQIEKGNLQHRIPVRRQDQLAALSTSFNTMAGSVAELLVQQRANQNMQRELAIAQEVQNNLFPQAPIELPGFELHGVCKPARIVGGDYYDFIPSGSSLVYLALGDISGKGISAALLMASLHSAVRAYRFGEPSPTLCQPPESTPSPARLLALLNRHLYTTTQPERYATLFLACYDSATRKLVYSTAGHLPPLVLCANGECKRLDCGGSVVGLLDGMVYREATLQLDPGDLLVAYSDGLTEPENEWGEWGEQRLLALIHRHRDQPLSVIANHATRAVEQWIGAAEQPDDITLVLARQL